MNETEKHKQQYREYIASLDKKILELQEQKWKVDADLERLVKELRDKK